MWHPCDKKTLFLSLPHLHCRLSNFSPTTSLKDQGQPFSTATPQFQPTPSLLTSFIRKVCLLWQPWQNKAHTARGIKKKSLQLRSIEWISSRPYFIRRLAAKSTASVSPLRWEREGRNSHKTSEVTFTSILAALAHPFSFLLYSL